MRPIVAMLLEQGYGMINCGEHLGVMMAPAEQAKACPPGWAFVDSETATEEKLELAMDAARSGRSQWPEAEN